MERLPISVAPTYLGSAYLYIYASLIYLCSAYLFMRRLPNYAALTYLPCVIWVRCVVEYKYYLPAAEVDS